MHVFIHIPKCAGTSFNTLLSRAYGRKHVYHVPASVIDNGRKHIEDRRDMAGVRLVRGHFVHGMHDSIEGHVEYFTILREPLARMGSYLNHMAAEARFDAENDARYYSAVRNWEGAERHFQLHPRPLDNAMTRAISGVNFAPGECNSNILKQARDNLNRMQAFGIFERLNESAALMTRRFKWHTIPVLSKTKAGNPSVIKLNDEDKRFLLDLNRYDQQLYGYAYERFETMIAQEPQLRQIGKVCELLTPAVTLSERLLRAILTRQGKR